MVHVGNFSTGLYFDIHAHNTTNVHQMIYPSPPNQNIVLKLKELKEAVFRANTQHEVPPPTPLPWEQFQLELFAKSVRIQEETTVV